MSRSKAARKDAGLYCNDVPMKTRVAGGAFVLPNGLPTESRITLEAKTSIATVARHSMFLTGDFSLPSIEPAGLLDSAVSPSLRTDSNGRRSRVPTFWVNYPCIHPRQPNSWRT